MRGQLYLKLNQLSSDYKGLIEEESFCKQKLRVITSSEKKQEFEKILVYIHQEKLRLLDEMANICTKLQSNSIEQRKVHLNYDPFSIQQPSKTK